VTHSLRNIFVRRLAGWTLWKVDLEDVKCGAGERRRSVGLIVW